MDARFSRVVDGLMTELTSSDDVLDKDSALSFAEDRIAFLASVLDAAQASRLREALGERIEAW